MKQPKSILVHSVSEYHILTYSLIDFRNKLILQGRYTDAVDEFLRALQFDDCKAVFTMRCRLCTVYEYKDFMDG